VFNSSSKSPAPSKSPQQGRLANTQMPFIKVESKLPTDKFIRQRFNDEVEEIMFGFIQTYRSLIIFIPLSFS